MTRAGLSLLKNVGTRCAILRPRTISPAIGTQATFPIMFINRFLSIPTYVENTSRTDEHFPKLTKTSYLDRFIPGDGLTNRNGNLKDGFAVKLVVEISHRVAMKQFQEKVATFKKGYPGKLSVVPIKKRKAMPDISYFKSPHVFHKNTQSKVKFGGFSYSVFAHCYSAEMGKDVLQFAKETQKYSHVTMTTQSKII